MPIGAFEKPFIMLLTCPLCYKVIFGDQGDGGAEMSKQTHGHLLGSNPFRTQLGLLLNRNAYDYAVN